MDYIKGINKPLLLIIFIFFNINLLAQCISGNCENGYGTYRYSNNDTYTGNWKNDLRQGEGTYIWNNGDKYIGHWENDNRTGYGVYYYSDGDIYEGSYVNNIRTGIGNYYFKSGSAKLGGKYENGSYVKGTGTYVENYKYKPKDFGASYSNFSIRKIIPLKKSGGVYTVSCKVNGLALSFIFDTGASDVLISIVEAAYMLKHGYLSKNDILGSQYYSTASGDIMEGTTIIIKELEFEGIVLRNIKASVSSSIDAPLLLGQSALSKLGKIQIDYSNNTLTIYK